MQFSPHIKIELTKAFLFYCPPHHVQFYRPYESSLDGHALNHFYHYTDDGSNITPSTLSNIASSIIRPSAIPQGSIDIANGFGNERFAFFMEFTIDSGGIYGSKKKEIVSGFTSHIGVDSKGNIDPQTVFFINARQTLNEVNAHVGPTGYQSNAIVQENQSILPKLTGGNFVGLRPEDIVAGHQVNDMMGGEVTIDKRVDLSTQYMTSQKDNVIPSYYLSRILNGYKAGLGEGNSFNNNDLYSDVIKNVRTNSLYVSDFISEIRGNDASNYGYFTFAEIQGRWPRLPEFWIKRLPPPNRYPIAKHTYTQDWQAPLVETEIAYNLTHALPVLMSKMMLIELIFDMHNMTFDGSADICVMNIVSMFDNAIDPNKIQVLINRIKIDIVEGLVANRCGSFYIKVKANILKENDFEIQINGQNPIPYSAPMFCESYYSPLFGDRNHLNRLVGEVTTMVENMGQRGSFGNAYRNIVDPSYFGDGSEQLDTNMNWGG